MQGGKSDRQPRYAKPLFVGVGGSKISPEAEVDDGETAGRLANSGGT